MLAGKLCHDFISPSGAVVAGLDLMNDPSAGDMREDALGLIDQSARKMVALVHFARLAFGAAGGGEGFKPQEVEALVRGVTDGGRATAEWSLASNDLTRTQARVLSNLAYIGANALPTGGVAHITSMAQGGRLTLRVVAEGPRARLKAEALTGLAGAPMAEGLPGQWIQPYWLWRVVGEAEGSLTVDAAEEGRVVLTIDLPA